MGTFWLETNLEKIKELGELREDENFRFRTFLKNRNDHKIDVLVHRLNEDISSRIDCTTCGNCCKELSPCVTKEDLKKLTEATHMPVEEVISTYTESDEDGLSFKHLPCSFFKDNKCSIYPHRPETCVSYPHLHKPQFTSRLLSVISNYSICPIVYNVFERLKQEMGFETGWKQNRYRY